MLFSDKNIHFSAGASCANVFLQSVTATPWLMTQTHSVKEKISARKSNLPTETIIFQLIFFEASKWFNSSRNAQKYVSILLTTPPQSPLVLAQPTFNFQKGKHDFFHQKGGEVSLLVKSFQEKIW